MCVPTVRPFADRARWSCVRERRPVGGTCAPASAVNALLATRRVFPATKDPGAATISSHIPISLNPTYLERRRAPSHRLSHDNLWIVILKHPQQAHQRRIIARLPRKIQPVILPSASPLPMSQIIPLFSLKKKIKKKPTNSESETAVRASSSSPAPADASAAPVSPPCPAG